MKLNLGCAGLTMVNFVGVDKYPGIGVDIVMDLNKDWDFKDGSIDEIFASHLIEHLDNFDHFMRECYRVLKPKGKMAIRVPYGNSLDAMACCFHKRPFYERSFTLFTKDDDNSRFCYQYKDRPVFKILQMDLVVNPIVKKHFPFGLWKKIMWLRMYIMNIVLEMQILLEKE